LLASASAAFAAPVLAVDCGCLRPLCSMNAPWRAQDHHGNRTLGAQRERIVWVAASTAVGDVLPRVSAKTQGGLAAADEVEHENDVRVHVGF
jgi:hypothetical protein